MNGYLKKRQDINQAFLDAGEQMGVQKMWDYMQLALRDPKVMGKDTFGVKRLEKVFEAMKAMAMIEDAPTVDAVEVVHGRWVWKPINERTSRLYCSVCDRDDGACEEYTYCPNCGAKMDGDGNGNP